MKPRVLYIIASIFVVIGIIMLLVYYFKPNQKMFITTQSIGIKNCHATEESNLMNKFDTSKQAENACMGDKNCVAFDWNGYDNTLNSPIIPPTTIFYNKIDEKCIVEKNKDDKNINTSGIKKSNSSSFSLWIGFILLIVGVGLFITPTFLKKSEKSSIIFNFDDEKEFGPL